eukprot:COSAG02_NODE_7372_length_3058_cov_1.996604_1_plen_158_part_00
MSVVQHDNPLRSSSGTDNFAEDGNEESGAPGEVAGNLPAFFFPRDLPSVAPDVKKKAAATPATDAVRAVDAPANFHQAATVYLLGGSSAKYTGAMWENASRCTNAEMEAHWKAAEGKIGKQERLVCNFCSLSTAGKNLNVDKIGFRASKEGQAGGGL